ncbi:hypothetical protein [Ralstonia sp. SET104]|uniref:hypothetical protein n=1 Tax=Ralstonia sp. SET104 TaxID=2448774 RepID=UPI000F57412E|nr:hypothetical protein [Ralstonia sp. SET104]GCB06548.1 hypothetical protein PSUB009319_41790 [Ralstonia sp. SET104]
MADQKEQDDRKVTEGETPADFLTKLSKALCEKDGMDVGLVDILTEHVLTTAPNTNAVVRAKEAILKLASERANLPK